MSAPKIVNATPDENDLARKACRTYLSCAISCAAEELGDQPLAIKQLMAKLLVEDFAALDADATQLWLAAASWEVEPTTEEVHAAAIADRRAAFDRLCAAEIAGRAT